MCKFKFVYLLFVSVLLTACWAKATPTPQPTPTPTQSPPTPTPLPSDTPAWFRQAVVYQIVPHSFYDSDGDGMGDLNGVTQRLDYVRELGATAIWLTPVLSATSVYGYDVVDHLSVAAMLGSPQDMLTLVNEAHARDVRVLIDPVIGYTSDQHPFFRDAYRKPASPHSNWYAWKDKAHTIYQAVADDASLPRLNMEEPAVQDYMVSVALHWMDPNGDGDLRDGVDGFIGQAQFAPPAFWSSLRQRVKAARPDCLLVGYGGGELLEDLPPYYDGPFDAMLDMPLYRSLTGNPEDNTDGALNSQATPLAVTQYITQQASLLPPLAQVVRFLNYHDTNRIAAELGDNDARMRQAAALLLTLPGTPLVYYGEEISMRGSLLPASSDKETHKAIATYRREPMDWYTAGEGAGMPTWFRPDDRSNRVGDGISVEEQKGQKSLLEFYRNLITQRRTHLALTLGAFQPVATYQCSACLAYCRWHENDMYLIIFNFADQTQAITVDLSSAPPRPSGPSQDVLRGGVISVPSDGRYTVNMDANGVRVVHWGQP